MFGRRGKNGRLEFTTDRRVCPDRRWFYKGDRRDGRYCRTSSLCRLGGPCRAYTGTVSLPLTHTLCNLDRAEKPAFYSPNTHRVGDGERTRRENSTIYRYGTNFLLFFENISFLLTFSFIKEFETKNSNPIAKLSITWFWNASFITFCGTFRNFSFFFQDQTWMYRETIEFWIWRMLLRFRRIS